MIRNDKKNKNKTSWTGTGSHEKSRARIWKWFFTIFFNRIFLLMFRTCQEDGPWRYLPPPYFCFLHPWLGFPASQSHPLFQLGLSLPYIKDVRLLPISKRHFTSFVSRPAPVSSSSSFLISTPSPAAHIFLILQSFGWTCPSFKFQKFVSIRLKSCPRWLAPSSS